jgi:hypothetical protein
MEASGSSHYWAREIQALGHEVVFGDRESIYLARVQTLFEQPWRVGDSVRMTTLVK